MNGHRLSVSTQEPVSAKSLTVKAQKKILSTMANKHVAKLFIDDHSAQLLDNLYQLTATYDGASKRKAEKLLKYSIKTAIKLIVLLRNNLLSSHELDQCAEFRKKLHAVAVTFISFYEVDFSFDRAYLSGLLKECGGLLKSIVRSHLTGKSLARIDTVFGFYADEDFLEWLFLKENHRDELKSVVEDLHVLLNEKVI